MGLQEGTRAVEGGKPFSSKHGKLEKGFVSCTAANPSGQRERNNLKWQLSPRCQGQHVFTLHSHLLILAGVTHMPRLCLRCAGQAPSPAPPHRAGGEQKPGLVQRARNLSLLAKAEAACFISLLFEGLQGLKIALKRTQDFPLML